MEVFFNCALDMCEEVGLKMYRYGRYMPSTPSAPIFYFVCTPDLLPHLKPSPA